MNNTTGSDIIPWRKAGAAQKDPSDPQAVTPIRFDRMHAMLQREEERVMRALVKQAILLEESGAVRPELCRRFLRAYRAQARGESSALLLDQGDPLTGTPAAGLLWGVLPGICASGGRGAQEGRADAGAGGAARQPARVCEGPAGPGPGRPSRIALDGTGQARPTCHDTCRPGRRCARPQPD